MPFDEYLSERIEQALKRRSVSYVPKKMFGGICFMVDDKMCLGVVKNELMARVDPDEYASLLKVKGARQMDFTKRPMKGFLFIGDEGIDDQENLEFWINKCLNYNPKAGKSKKKK